jgi:aminocarboxymuconate-semialdehyde decarboxylase
LLVFGPVRFTAREVWFDASRRLEASAASAASGVDAEVVSPFPPLLNYRLDAGSGLDLARWVNEYIAGLCAAAPGRIYGLGTVPLQDPDLAAGELGAVRELGLAGVEIGSSVGGVSLADERFGGFFPAMPREEPAGRTLRWRDLSPEVLEDITWHNCFRFLGMREPKASG